VNVRLAQFGAEQVPFWMRFGISPVVLLYIVGLTVLGAVIVGVVPALKATRRRVNVSLQQLAPGGGAGMRLGKTWTALIIAQVAIAVVILPITIDGITKLVARELAKPPTTDQFLTASLSLDREGAGSDDFDALDETSAARFANVEAELVRRLEAEPGVTDVVLAESVPGGEPKERFDVEATAQTATTAKRDAAPASAAGFQVGVGRVDLGFFNVFGVPILAGRPFSAADAAPNATAVIVNRSFVQHVLGGGDPLGRRVRPAVRDEKGVARADRGPWFEIVGVVPDFPKAPDARIPEPRLYQALRPGTVNPATLAIHVRGTAPESLADRVRVLTVAVDPMLRLGTVRTLGQNVDFERELDKGILLAVALVTLSIVLLSAAGIYALMSFTIARRRREIGIRAALGAGPRRVLVSVLSRAAVQIGTGIVSGSALVMLMQSMATNGMSVRVAGLVASVAVLMTVVGLAAAIGPARRALAIQPTEALKME